MRFIISPLSLKRGDAARV